MPSKDKIAKNKKTIARVSALSGLAALSIGTGAILSSCSGVAWSSTVQIVVSDASSTLADQSFSESAFNGLRNFYKEIGAGDAPQANSTEILEGNGFWKRPGLDDDSRIQTYENIKNEGSNIVLATGFNQGDALQKITSTDSEYATQKENLKNTGFVFVDGAIQKDFNGKTSDPTNVASIAYRADQGSFLVGLSTAVYLNENWKSFVEDTSKVPETIGVSGFVGLAIPSTISFLNGFRQGLIYWNSISSLIKIDDGTTDAIKMKWISPSDSEGDLDINAHASGSFDANSQTAITLTNKLIEKGAKVIFPIAGPQTQLVVDNVVQQGKNVAVIGVDTAQENITNLKKPMPKPVEGSKATEIIPFSSLKDITYSSQQVLNAIKTGKTSNGYEGFGYNNLAGLDNKGVGISDAGKQYLIDPLFFTEALGSSGNGEGNNDSGKDPSKSSKKEYDISSLISQTTSKTWKLSDLKRGNSSETEYNKIYDNYKMLLTDVTIKYSAEEKGKASYEIIGDELTKAAEFLSSEDQKLLPKFIYDDQKNNTAAKYDIKAAFGGDKTTKVAIGTVLDGANWTYAFSKK